MLTNPLLVYFSETMNGQPLTFRRIGDVLAHLAGRPGNEEADRHAQAHPAEQDHIARLVNLTPRERDVLRVLAATGGSNKSIARELDISPGTVKVLLRTVLSKLRLHNRTEAAVWYRERQDVGHLTGRPRDRAQDVERRQSRIDSSEDPVPLRYICTEKHETKAAENAADHLSPHHVREDERRVPAGISDEGRYHQRAYRKCQVF